MVADPAGLRIFWGPYPGSAHCRVKMTMLDKATTFGKSPLVPALLTSPWEPFYTRRRKSMGTDCLESTTGHLSFAICQFFKLTYFSKIQIGMIFMHLSTLIDNHVKITD